MQYVFVTNLRSSSGGASEIDYWPVRSGGNVPPAGVITGHRTGLDGAGGIAIDRKGEIYVANRNDKILAFPPGSNGNARPTVTIAGPRTGLAHPVGLAFDSIGNLYVANCGAVCGGKGSPSIEEFPAESNGNIKPSRVIAGSNTGFTKPHGIAVASNGEIYLANAGLGSPPAAIEVFSARANGNQQPIRRIDGPRTRLRQSGGGMALDRNGVYTDSWERAVIVRFALNANGDVQPIARIKGYKTQLRPELDGMSIGPNATFYAVDRGDETPRVVQFVGLADGNVFPITMIRGTNTRLEIPLSVAFGSRP